MRPTSLNQPTRTKHQTLPELVNGLDLSRSALLKIEDQSNVATLVEILTNAEYWLSYEPESFDHELMLCPSPLRELGIGIALRFGHSLNGDLTEQDIEQCRQLLSPELSNEMADGVERALQTLKRVVEIRQVSDTYRDQGYQLYEESKTLSVHALRASGRATIKLDGRMVSSSNTPIMIGQAVKIAALDEKGRPLSLPEIFNSNKAPIYYRDSPEQDYRECIFAVPGMYRVSVPTRPEGGHKLLVS